LQKWKFERAKLQELMAAINESTNENNLESCKINADSNDAPELLYKKIDEGRLNFFLNLNLNNDNVLNEPRMIKNKEQSLEKVIFEYIFIYRFFIK
jgi:hypothetical protein